MKPGDVVLIRLPQVGVGAPKLRPALVLAMLRGVYQDVLLCGISTQLAQINQDWDELLQPGDNDFVQSGLHRASIIRLSYLHSVDSAGISGRIGGLSTERLKRLRTRLANSLL